MQKDWKLDHIIVKVLPVLGSEKMITDEVKAQEIHSENSVSQVSLASSPKFAGQGGQLPKFDHHLNQIPEKESLNQASSIDSFSKKEGDKKNQVFQGKGQKTKTPDFNFWGLGEGEIENPFEMRTVLFLMKLTGLNLEQMQESVMRFSRYYFGNQNFKKQIKNPVAYLIAHLKKNRSVFIEPEWFLEELHHEYDSNESKNSNETYDHVVSAVNEFLQTNPEITSESKSETKAANQSLQIQPSKESEVDSRAVENCLHNMFAMLDEQEEIQKSKSKFNFAPVENSQSKLTKKSKEVEFEALGMIELNQIINKNMAGK